MLQGAPPRSNWSSLATYSQALSRQAQPRRCPAASDHPGRWRGRGRMSSQTASPCCGSVRARRSPCPSAHTFLSSWRDCSLLGGRAQGTCPRERLACLPGTLPPQLVLGCTLLFNLHQIKDCGSVQTEKLRLRKDYVHRPVAAPRGGSPHS